MNDYVLDVKNLLPRYAELFCENISLSLTYIKRKNNPQFIVFVEKAILHTTKSLSPKSLLQNYLLNTPQDFYFCSFNNVTDTD